MNDVLFVSSQSKEEEIGRRFASSSANVCRNSFSSREADDEPRGS